LLSLLLWRCCREKVEVVAKIAARVETAEKEIIQEIQKVILAKIALTKKREGIDDLNPIVTT